MPWPQWSTCRQRFLVGRAKRGRPSVALLLEPTPEQLMCLAANPNIAGAANLALEEFATATTWDNISAPEAIRQLLNEACQEGATAQSFVERVELATDIIDLAAFEEEYANYQTCDGRSGAQAVRDAYDQAMRDGGCRGTRGRMEAVLNGTKFFGRPDDPFSQFRHADGTPLVVECKTRGGDVNCPTCTPYQLALLQNAYAEAGTRLSCTIDVLKSCVEADNFNSSYPCNQYIDRFEQIFGTRHPVALYSALQLYRYLYAVSDHDTYRTQPADEGICSGSFCAWTFQSPLQVVDITLCDPTFFSMNSGCNPVETLIHEWAHTHLVSDDIRYSHEAGFFDLSPFQAFFNADSYSEFAMLCQ